MPLKQTQRTQIQHTTTSVRAIPLKKLSLLTKCCSEHGSHICYTFSGSLPLLTRNEDAGTTHQLLAARFTPTSVQTTACGARPISQVKNRRPSQSLSREVVDGEGMVQTANRTLRLRTSSAAATSANLKRPVRVRLYPRAPCFAPALSCRHRHRYVS